MWLGGKLDPSTVPSENATFMLSDLLNNHCEKIVVQLEEGELCDAGESMLLVLDLMSCQRAGLNHAMHQVKRITSSSAMHICAVRDAIRTLQRTLLLLCELVQSSPAVLNQLRGNALSELDNKQLNKINSIYGAFAPAVKQIRGMLLELLAENLYSELQYLGSHIMSLLWKLFDPVNQTHPLLSVEASVFKEKGVASTVDLMKACANTLHRISSVLHMVELTIGTEVFISTIKQDLLSYRSFSRNAASKIASFVSSKKRPSLSDEIGDDAHLAISHGSADLPKCVSDLIGYSIARTAYVQSDIKRVASGDYSELVWFPASVSQVLRLQLLPDSQSQPSIAQLGAEQGLGSGVDAAGVVDISSIGRNIELGIEKIDHLWDFYALLGEYKYEKSNFCSFIVEYI